MSQINECKLPDVVTAFRWWNIKQLRKTVRLQGRRNG
jgi:hypothetical protein